MSGTGGARNAPGEAPATGWGVASRMLQHYRIYLLDRNFRICVAHDVLCPDDETACEAAAALSNDQWWELWHGRERIRRGKGNHHVPAESLH